jgi:hypothetical protein
MYIDSEENIMNNSFCKKCGKPIRIDIQGNEVGERHKCVLKLIIPKPYENKKS